MKARISIYSFVLCSFLLNAQEIDSVSAILIKYDVQLDIKESLAGLLDEPDLQEIYYILRENIVLIKEVHKYQDDLFFRCVDTKRKRQYSCSMSGDRILARREPSYFNMGTIIPHMYGDSVQVIDGYPCKPVNVMIDGSFHEVWYTDVFGTQFSAIADLPGIPLYYERTNYIDGKLKFRALDVKPIMVPAYYFDIGRYDLFDDQILSGREVYTSVEKMPSLSRKTLDGRQISTSDNEGKVMFFTFWQPKYNNLDGDIEALNTLKKEFEGENILFVACNTLSSKRAIKELSSSDLDFLHIPNADYLFENFLIDKIPNHILVDKRGNLRYRYKGILGEPLLNSMRRDIQLLLPSPTSTSKTPLN